MRALNMTFRDLAAKISTATQPITHSTIWAWTKNADGYPVPKTYTAAVNRRLANALSMNPDALAQAYEQSRRTLIIQDPNPIQNTKLALLRRIFDDSRQEKWTRAEIVKVIDDVCAG